MTTQNGQDDERRLVVPAGEARAIRLRRDVRFAVVDLDGGQVGDLFAFTAADLEEFASPSHTRSVTNKLFPRPGDVVYTNLRRPILRLEEDHSPGRHDALYAACDQQRYAMLGAEPGHRSCVGNLAEAMAPFGGLAVPAPQPFNVFMDVRVDGAGNTIIDTATSRPGDHLIFRTLLEAVVVLSACPWDLDHAISSGGVTPLAVRILSS